MDDRSACGSSADFCPSGAAVVSAVCPQPTISHCMPPSCRPAATETGQFGHLEAVQLRCSTAATATAAAAAATATAAMPDSGRTFSLDLLPSSAETSPVRPVAAVRVSEFEQISLRLQGVMSANCAYVDQDLCIIVEQLRKCNIGTWNGLSLFLSAPYFEKHRTALASQLSEMANYCFFVEFKESLQVSAAAVASDSASAVVQEPVPADEFARLVITQLLPYIASTADVNDYEREQVARQVRESLLASVNPPTLRADLQYSCKPVQKAGNESTSVTISLNCFGCTKSGCGRTLQLRPNSNGTYSLPNKNFLGHIYKKKTPAADSPQPTQMQRNASSSDVSSGTPSRSSSNAGYAIPAQPAASTAHQPAAASANGMQQRF
jgi:hypothetical protein